MCRKEKEEAKASENMPKFILHHFLSENHHGSHSLQPQKSHLLHSLWKEKSYTFFWLLRELWNYGTAVADTVTQHPGPFQKGALSLLPVEVSAEGLQLFVPLRTGSAMGVPTSNDWPKQVLGAL